MRDVRHTLHPPRILFPVGGKDEPQAAPDNEETDRGILIDQNVAMVTLTRRQNWDRCGSVGTVLPVSHCESTETCSPSDSATSPLVRFALLRKYLMRRPTSPDEECDTPTTLSHTLSDVKSEESHSVEPEEYQQGVSKRKQPRPPADTEYVVTDELVAAVLAERNRERGGDERIAERLEARVGYKVHRTTIVQIAEGQRKKSSLAWDLADMLGAPLPPVFARDEELGQAWSEFRKLKEIDSEAAQNERERIRKMLELHADLTKIKGS